MTDQKKAILFLLQTFVEAVQAAGSQGLPGGHLYAAVMDKIGLDTFERIMSALVTAGNISKRGELYFYVKGL